MNDHKIVRRLRRRYPDIAKEIAPKPATKAKDIHPYFEKYAAVTAQLPVWVSSNTRNMPTIWNEPRTMFIAVMIRLVDPLALDDTEVVDRWFITSMTELLGCKNTQILYALRKARNFYKLYPEFKREVDAIFEKMTADNE